MAGSRDRRRNREREGEQDERIRDGENRRTCWRQPAPPIDHIIGDNEATPDAAAPP
jgi:hypothetical protein